MPIIALCSSRFRSQSTLLCERILTINTNKLGGIILFVVEIVNMIIDFFRKTKNEFLNSTAQWGDGILSRTVDIYSFIQSCYGYDSF